MKAATINELKLELTTIPAEQLAALCIRLAKFKKENKELLTYLLFESFDEHAYMENIKTVGVPVIEQVADKVKPIGNVGEIEQLVIVPVTVGVMAVITEFSGKENGLPEKEIVGALKIPVPVPTPVVVPVPVPVPTPVPVLIVTVVIVALSMNWV